MRLALVSDIHSNRVALDAVREDMPAVDGVVCAGDVVGYNSWPAECLDWVRDHDVPTVQGNHDRMVASDRNFLGNGMAAAGVDLARERLTDAEVDWLGSLPTERTVADGRVKVVHGHPEDPDRYTYPEEFTASLLDEEDVLVMGHTHVQGHERFPEGLVVNPGSVGQPRDRDPRAAYAVLDLADLTVEERRVPYDVEEVVAAVADADLPSRTGERLRQGR